MPDLHIAAPHFAAKLGVCILTAIAAPLAVEFSPEALTVVGTLVLALSGAVGILWRQNQKQTDDRLAELKGRIETLQKVSDTATDVAQQVVFKELKSRGIAIVEPLAAVVPIHNSPVTEKQIADAKIDTVRAKLAAVVLAAQMIPDILPPRIETAKEIEDGPRKSERKGHAPIGSLTADGEITGSDGAPQPVKIEGTITPP